MSHIFLLVNLTYYYLILGWQSQVPKVSLLLPCCIILAYSMTSTINNRCNPYVTFKASFVTSYFVSSFKVQGNVKTPAYMYAEIIFSMKHYFFVINLKNYVHAMQENII